MYKTAELDGEEGAGIPNSIHAVHLEPSEWPATSPLSGCTLPHSHTPQLPIMHAAELQVSMLFALIYLPYKTDNYGSYR